MTQNQPLLGSPGGGVGVGAGMLWGSGCVSVTQGRAASAASQACANKEMGTPLRLAADAG